MTDFTPVGEGLTVFTVDAPVEGVFRWLDSPQEVLDLAATDAVRDTIACVRGGTTTFLTPALNAGVKGIVTLQGAPESHLGILSREYGIPCLMGVGFERGVRSLRGEVVPADGVQVRLDLSARPKGTVHVEAGAPEADAGTPTAQPAMSPEELAQIQVLLERFGGEVPHGPEGDAQFRSTLSTRVLQLDDDSMGRDLHAREVNDLSRYAGWNMWDCLAARATEGESGLIPRQEYEALAFVQIWQRYPEVLRRITEAVGAEGVVELGARARTEIGTKVNLLHHWAVGFAVAFGRGITLGLELGQASDRTADLAEALQFQRRLYRGSWGQDGADMFTAMRGYRAPLLEQRWLDRFADELEPLDDPERRATFQRFNASTEMLGFLLHFDNRAGLSDSGPYPAPDGGFLIVRDHFLHETPYAWSTMVEPGLPYAVTQVMHFGPDSGLDVQVVDIGTLFTEPANYLSHLKGTVVYARDTWDTPVEQVRRLEQDELERIATGCVRSTERLYPHIAAMSRQEKVLAGAKVYVSDFVLPYARAAGVWDEVAPALHELDPVAWTAYEPLVAGGQAAALVPRLFLTGTGFPEVPDAPPEVAAVYERFLAANGDFKALVSRFQDADGDERFELAGRLGETVERVEPILRRTAEHLPRFDGYRERLTAALAKVDDGDQEWVASVRCDSLHTVWMELHEDYLTTLGRSREQEGSF